MERRRRIHLRWRRESLRKVDDLPRRGSGAWTPSGVASGVMDGIDLAREVKMRWPLLPVILTSGHPRERSANSRPVSLTLAHLFSRVIISITRGNIAQIFATLTLPAESGLVGWGGRIRTPASRNQIP
jgi:hypothetical protein